MHNNRVFSCPRKGFGRRLNTGSENTAKALPRPVPKAAFPRLSVLTILSVARDNIGGLIFQLHYVARGASILVKKVCSGRLLETVVSAIYVFSSRTAQHAQRTILILCSNFVVPLRRSESYKQERRLQVRVERTSKRVPTTERQHAVARKPS